MAYKLFLIVHDAQSREFNVCYGSQGKIIGTHCCKKVLSNLIKNYEREIHEILSNETHSIHTLLILYTWWPQDHKISWAMLIIYLKFTK